MGWMKELVMLYEYVDFIGVKLFGNIFVLSCFI